VRARLHAGLLGRHVHHLLSRDLRRAQLRVRWQLLRRRVLCAAMTGAGFGPC
jgi:hypothetical protein